MAPKKETRRGGSLMLFGIAGVMVLVVGGALAMLPNIHSISYEREREEPHRSSDTGDIEVVDAPVPALPKRADFATRYLPTPVPLKGIYMTQCVVGTPSLREDLVRFIEETELNAIVIDVKDFSGGVAFPTEHPLVSPFRSSACGAYDMREFVAQLKEKGIYTIARITVFQDPMYASAHPEAAVKRASNPSEVWRDNKGLNFIDVSARPFWEYIVALSRESHKLGFDELNFDYVRFPSDGPMHDIHFPHTGTMPKADALEHFFAYLHTELTEPSQYPEGVAPPVLSADLFGFTTSNTDDLGIGQLLERALPYFDYVMPMVYPSHYPRGAFGFDNPNQHPYGIIHRAMGDGVRRVIASRSTVKTFASEPIYEERIVSPAGTTTATTTERVFTGYYTKPVYEKNVLRPWLQDFRYGGVYDAAAIQAQIQGSEDAGVHSWIFWDPANRYSSLRAVLATSHATSLE